MDYLPIFMNVRGQRCLLVGAGEVASRKAALLVRTGATLIVVAPWISDPVRDLVNQHGGEIHERGFTDNDLNDVVLAIAATDDDKVNRHVSELARERNLPVNVVDQTELCSFIVPAIVDRSPVVVAISTGGSSPVLTRQLKEKIDIMLPAAYGRLAAMLGSLRDRVKLGVTDFSRRTRFWEKLLSGPLPELMLSGREQEAMQLFETSLARADDDQSQGEVYLVGAGPGDPDLLTLKALRLMYAADVVLYDRLVSPEIMKRVRPDADKVFVGKEAKHHPVPQEQINDMLVRLAREGKKVLRLKGGDPFIFGRGGEEIDQLAAAGLPFQVVPGVTAASGCAAYAGIPLTHRDFSQSVRFVTGHMKNDEPDLDWPVLAKEDQTLVIYMGLITLPVICEQLQAYGMNSAMPVAIVEQGTLPQQRVVTGTLQDIAGKVEAAGVKAPAIIIVGQVVKLHRELAWFGH
ncbi:uroporphyrinogen-III C-methyltransferase [Pseudohongiella acticola]|uniref:Siroheme synthase n=1 Tax=Pseudohongiella acticola TaxID=1524254 RepID=A0A1E8CI06_9GAMM|nr:siroheme synthase CysG [Pseudohongiella acticola]OFE11925.1 uroporphyrinogen-III C-methyltransferase [Pseudohongiella acticola]